MTAPAITPTAPATPANDASLDAASAMEETIRATLDQSAGIDGIPQSDRPRDPSTGKFVPATSTDTPLGGADGTAPTIESGDPAGDETPPVIEIPDGYVAPPTLSDEKAVGFKVRDAEGDIVPPDLTWEFTANGKPRSVDTAKLIQYAQQGVYNHEREQAYQQTQRQTHDLQQRNQQLEQAYGERNQVIERLLSDPDYLVRSLQGYEQQNTPEARAQRAREEVEQERQQLHMQQMEQQSEQFVNTRLAPALDIIANNLPTVSREELAARLFLAADKYRMNGVLLPDGHTPLATWVATDLLAWAQQLHEERTLERQAPHKAAEDAKQQAKTDIEKAQARAQKAKRAATAATRPLGRVMPETQPPKQIRTKKDAEDAVIGNTMSALRATG